MRETAYAKINLALHVRERQDDGYHQIETVFAFAEDGDTLGVVGSDALTLDVTGPFASALGTSSDNLVMRAATALRERFGIKQGAALALDKALPVAAGIGGGSADAAAALRLLARLWGIAPDDPALGEIAAGLGADVPACLRSTPSRGEGKGDLLEDLDLGLSGTPLLLVNPGIALATSAVFAGWDGVDRGPLRDWRDGRNDLEAPARRLVPEIEDALDLLEGAWLRRMSGSGATCFGLYRSADERDAAAERIRHLRPSFWCLATRLR